MSHPRLALAIALTIAPPLALAAQPASQASPLDAATTPAADKPATITTTPAVIEPDVQKVLDMLVGTFRAASGPDHPELVLNSAAIPVEGLAGAVYFEIARADAAYEPFRSGVMHVYKRRGGELRLRVFDLVGVGGMRDALAGLYLAPSAYPTLALKDVDPNVDVPLAAAGPGYTGKTQSPVPTTRDGAIEMTTTVAIAPDKLSFDDRGFDVAGQQVWGPTGDAGIAFARAERAPATVSTTADGLVIMTMTPAPQGAEPLVPGGQVAVHYSGWLTNGTRFDTSRQPGREPFLIRIPGGVIRGWNEGLAGIAKGERRRLVVPPALAYGERGAGRGLIPPNSTLIFEIECLHVDNANPVLPTPPAPPPPAATPTPTPGAQPAPGSGGERIGNPPAGSGPEKPK